MKLFSKYNRVNLSVMALIFVLSGIAYYFLVSSIFIHELDESLHDYRERLHAYIKQNGHLPRFELFEDIIISGHQATSKAKEKYASVTRFDPEEQKQSVFREMTFTEKIAGTYFEFNIARPVEGTKFVTKTIAATTLIILLVIISSSVMLNRIILKNLWRPFYNTIKELGNFKLSKGYMPTFAPSDIDEFAFLNRTLSEVVRDANDDYRVLKEFTENAAHELQTPIAIIRSKLDLVIQDEGLSESQGDALKTAYTGINRLTKLNQSLLLLTRIENRQFSSVDDLDLTECLHDKIGQFRDFWAARHIKLRLALGPARLYANAELVDILFNNLLANAGRHNQNNGEILISLWQGFLTIKNTAIAGTLDTSRLFRRFYKEAAHSQSNGLGLSIIRQICDVQQIDITYRYEPGYHSFMLAWKS